MPDGRGRDAMFSRTIFSDAHEMFRDQVRRFVAAEIVPHHAQWEKEGRVSREAWLKAGAQAALEVRGATDLEADIKRRSLTARYGGVYDPCTILNGELAAQTPLSVLVKRRG